MPDILAIAEASMRNSMQQLDAISRNVANVNTQGYKREIYLNRGFRNYLDSAAAYAALSTAPASTYDPAGLRGVAAHASGPYSAISAAAAPTHAASIADDPSAAQYPDANTAGRVESHDFSSGSLKRTGSALHMAIEGKGYFQLQTPQGVVLTRDGQFRIDARGQLVAADGSPVVMKGGLTLDSAALDHTELRVLADGTISSGEQQAQIDLVDASDDALQLVAPGRYRANTTSVPEPGSYHVRQGYIENSNVDTLTEMTGMMSAVRQVEASQQLMRAYDEIIENAISTLGQF
jgi:flagellar basal body rod protein FlgG